MDYQKLQNGSDIRGVALEGIEGQHVNLTETACRDIGRGFALWLTQKTEKRPLRVAVGRDSRLSGPQLALWLMEAMAAEGLQVTDLGMASTPANGIPAAAHARTRATPPACARWVRSHWIEGRSRGVRTSISAVGSASRSRTMRTSSSLRSGSARIRSAM